MKVNVKKRDITKKILKKLLYIKINKKRNIELLKIKEVGFSIITIHKRICQE